MFVIGLELQLPAEGLLHLFETDIDQPEDPSTRTGT
jgi:hypothetical protein